MGNVEKGPSIGIVPHKSLLETSLSQIKTDKCISSLLKQSHEFITKINSKLGQNLQDFQIREFGEFSWNRSC